MATKGELKALLATLGITRSTSRRQVKDMLTDKGYTFPEYQVCDGASKICIVPKHADFVIKWSTSCLSGEEGYDEAYDEVLIYEKAVREGLEMFFPKTEILCTIGGINFVVQEKIDFSALNTPRNKDSKYLYKTKTVSPIIIDKIDTCFQSIGTYPDIGFLRFLKQPPES